MSLDIDNIEERVRFLLGNPSEDIISSEVLQGIITNCINSIGDEDENYCEVVQCSLMETLRFLIRQAQIPTSSDGNTLKRRKEKRSNTEIEVEYQTVSSSDLSSGWEAMYEDYQLHPEWICEELAKDSNAKYIVTIGGVRQDESRRVKRDPNSKSAYDTPRVNRKFWKTSTRSYYNRKR